MYVLNAYKTLFFYHNFATTASNYKTPLPSPLIWSAMVRFPPIGRSTITAHVPNSY